MRLSIRFETGAGQYAWLNTSVFVARGRPQGTGHWALGTSNIRCSGDVVCRAPHPLSSVRKSVGRRFAKRDARCAAGPADRDRAWVVGGSWSELADSTRWLSDMPSNPAP